MIDNMITDDIGRCFCKAHRRELCHECCYDFSLMNRAAEEEAGFVKKKAEVDVIAERKATIVFALEGMKRMVPIPNKETFELHREWLRDCDEELKRFERSGEDVAGAIARAMDKERGKNLEMDAMAQAWSNQNPGKTHWAFGGSETQKLYEKIAAKPSAKNEERKAEAFTCGYCGISGAKKFPICARCLKVAYCGPECQKAAWKAHKKVCTPSKNSTAKPPKTLPLTWDQLEARQGEVASGRVLEVRAMKDESMMRQVFSCKDRAGVIRRIAAYTNSRHVPGLKQGSILRWKNPRFHYFMDGSSGGRIEEADLENVTVTNT